MEKKQSINEFIEEYATRWNKKFYGYAGGWVGRLNVIFMLKTFLRAYKRRFK